LNSPAPTSISTPQPQPICFQARVKEERMSNSEEMRLKVSAFGVSNLDFVSENKQLLQAIGQWDAMDTSE